MCPYLVSGKRLWSSCASSTWRAGSETKPVETKVGEIYKIKFPVTVCGVQDKSLPEFHGQVLNWEL